jgi:hypothetical protein
MPMAEEHEQDPETLRDMLRESMTKDKNINVFVVDINPKLAEILLGSNDGNRPLKKRVLETYQRDMEAGDFVLTGETIILDKQWFLLNGQHRLNACILSGKPFAAIVVQGVDRSVYFKIRQRREAARSRLAVQRQLSGTEREGVRSRAEVGVAIRVRSHVPQRAVPQQRRDRPHA